MSAPPPLHAGQVDVDVELVDRLVGDQFPTWAGEPVRPFASTGTVNAVFRLGRDRSVRLPLLESGVRSLERELAWLPRLAPLLPCRIPEPLGAGRPGRGYPFPWGVHRWVEGEPYERALGLDEATLAADLAAFVRALRSIDPTLPGAPPTGRRPLRELDAVTRSAIDDARVTIDVDAAAAAWTEALEATAWDGHPVWIHNDLLPPNLLIVGGSLSAVIDFGAVGVGDPAADVVPAWSVFGPIGRAVYRTALGVDDATWARARGYALHQAALIIPYYAESNPTFSALAVETVEQVLADLAA